MIVEIADLQNFYKIDRSRVKKVIKKVLEERASAKLSIVFVDNDKIKELNRRFLGHNEVTDVISFPLNNSEKYLNGEIIVSVERALEVAHNNKLNAEAEIFLYVIHGVLHLLGYDDNDSLKAIAMHKKESELLGSLGYNMPVVEG